MTYKMTINLNMLRVFMKNIIMRNLNSTVVVTMNDSKQKMCKTHIFQQPTHTHTHTQRSYEVISARARYFASTLEQEKMSCLLLCHEIRESLKKKRNPMVELGGGGGQ
jgi:hypothetical protein